MLNIRPATQFDVPHIVAFLKKFAEFERLGGYLTVTPEKLRRAMFGEAAFVEALIAFEGNAPVGYAIFYPHFSSFRGECGLYLEDIFVDEDWRGRGFGLALLRKVALRAREKGYERIDFQVLKWNESAIRFYEDLGAVANEDETHFKFSGPAFHHLAGE